MMIIYLKKAYHSVLFFALLVLTACSTDHEIILDSEFIKYYSEGTAVDMLLAGDDGFLLAAQGFNTNSILMKVDRTGDLGWGRNTLTRKQK